MKEVREGRRGERDTMLLDFATGDDHIHAHYESYFIVGLCVFQCASFPADNTKFFYVPKAKGLL